MSLKFLNKKSWHTAGQLTQRRIFEAEAALAAKKKAEDNRERELQKELEVQQTRKLLSSHKNAWEEDTDDMRKKGGQLSFMYEAPPGLLGPVGEAAQQEEKRAKDMTASERFPEFKGAPVADAAGKTVGEVEKNQAFDPRAIKPLGLEVRNVRCVKCKKWGHQMGDDECPMKALSVETEKFRQQIEDPLMLFDGSSGAAVTDRLVLRQAIDGTHGGQGVDGSNLDILLSDDDEPTTGTGMNSSAVRKAAKRRVKELKKQFKSSKKDKKKKKHKKSKKQSDSDSSSSSDSEQEREKKDVKAARRDGAEDEVTRERMAERDGRSAKDDDRRRERSRERDGEREREREREREGDGRRERERSRGGHERGLSDRHGSRRDDDRERERERERERGGGRRRSRSRSRERRR